MRALGRRLGVEAPALYNHVASKDELLDGLVEKLVSEIDVPMDIGWKEALRRQASSTRELFARHAWAAALIDSRDRTGPNRLSLVDRGLGVLMGAGFSPAEAANAALILNSYTYGFERERPTPSIGGDAVGTKEAQEVLAAIPDGMYPNATRVAKEYAATLFDLDAVFDFGLGLILDGLAGSLERR